MTVMHTTKANRRFALAALAAALCLGSCAGTPGALEPPDVRLVGLTVLGASAESQRFRVDLTVTNPNAVRIPVDRVSFNLRLGGGGVMTGRTVQPFTLAPGASETVQLDVTSDLVSSVSRLVALLQGPSSAIPYDLDGLVTLSRGLRPTFPFSRRGEVPLAMPAGLR